MKKVFAILLALFLFNTLFGNDKKQKKDEPPQGDSYYQSFDEMDEKLEESFEAGMPKEKEDFQRRAKKSSV